MAKRSFFDEARFPLALAVGGLVVGFFVISAGRETYRGYQVRQEIQGLQAQVQQLEGKKAYLSQLVDRMQTQDSLDREARLRLGLQKPGEQVYFFEESAHKEDAPAMADVSDVVESNPRRWLRYFFTVPL